MVFLNHFLHPLCLFVYDEVKSNSDNDKDQQT